MKYYLIAGEASGDLHASRLMQSLKRADAEADFRFFGGDLMRQVGGTLVKHYRELAYMGFVQVVRHLPTILRNMKMCKQDIAQWHPDVVILVDYPGFNLNIAKYVKSKGICPVYYYISPKIWAWKEYRIKNIRRDVDELFSILPFEVDFFENKHHYPIHYVGNPTADEVRQFLHEADGRGGGALDCIAGLGPTEKPLIAVLCGSRRQEIKGNLPTMLQATDRIADQYQIVIAGAQAIEPDYYALFTEGHAVSLLPAGNTFSLLSKAHAALVTSGTATLETALFGCPQVVCYHTMLPALLGYLRRKVLKVKYVSLVNLIADREIVKELVADSFTLSNIEHELDAVLSGPARQEMLDGYQEVWQHLGQENAPDNAALIMTRLLRRRE
jgi:lipid-A-disaccharide synthase